MGRSKNVDREKRGFGTLIGLLLVTIIAAFIILKISSNDRYSGSQTIDDYNAAIDKAEEAKKMLERK